MSRLNTTVMLGIAPNQIQEHFHLDSFSEAGDKDLGEWIGEYARYHAHQTTVMVREDLAYAIATQLEPIILGIIELELSRIKGLQCTLANSALPTSPTYNPNVDHLTAQADLGSVIDRLVAAKVLIHDNGDLKQALLVLSNMEAFAEDTDLEVPYWYSFKELAKLLTNAGFE